MSGGIYFVFKASPTGEDPILTIEVRVCDYH
jgi:hypothetical protein